MKTCRTCGEEKPLCEFHDQKKSKDGKNSNCAVCQRVIIRKCEAKKRNADNVVRKDPFLILHR